MKHNKELDQILQEALSPDKEPSEWLNQKILRRAKETNNMDKKLKRRVVPAAAIVTAITVSLGSVGAFAAWKYLSPDKVAEEMKENSLMEAFKGEDSININESQTFGDLTITLLGVTSGKNLSQKESFSFDGLDESKTYVVTALENADGTPIEVEKPLEVSVYPLVKGLKPWQFDAFIGGAAAASMIENGIEYRITQCDTVEIFADRGLYISVMDGIPCADAYQYNEETGEITRNVSYKGINALFNLPIDKSKADPEAAQKRLKEMPSLSEDKANKENVMSKAERKMSIYESEGKQREEYADLVEGLTQVLTPDKDGIITRPAYKLGDSEVQVKEIKFSSEIFFKNNKVGETVQSNIWTGETNHDLYIETYTINKDGTLTFKVYHYLYSEEE